MKYKHVLDNFADLASEADQIITSSDKPAKTRYEQQAKKMNYRQVNEDNIDAIRNIVKTHGAKAVKFKNGQIKVDATTANMIIKVYDKLNSKNQTKFNQLANGTKQDFMKLHILLVLRMRKKEIL